MARFDRSGQWGSEVAVGTVAPASRPSVDTTIALALAPTER